MFVGGATLASAEDHDRWQDGRHDRQVDRRGGDRNHEPGLIHTHGPVFAPVRDRGRHDDWGRHEDRGRHDDWGRHDDRGRRDDRGSHYDRGDRTDWGRSRYN